MLGIRRTEDTGDLAHAKSIDCAGYPGTTSLGMRDLFYALPVQFTIALAMVASPRDQDRAVSELAARQEWRFDVGSQPHRATALEHARRGPRGLAHKHVSRPRAPRPAAGSPTRQPRGGASGRPTRRHRLTCVNSSAARG